MGVQLHRNDSGEYEVTEVFPPTSQAKENSLASFFSGLFGGSSSLDSNSFPIRQNWMGNKRLALLPYIEAQARHETRDPKTGVPYSSRLFREQSNLFGMKSPAFRMFVGEKAPDGRGYMTYKNKKQSVEDLLLWMEDAGFPLSVSGSRQYVRELKARRYFEAPEVVYLSGVNRGLRELQKEGFTGFKIGSI